MTVFNKTSASSPELAEVQPSSSLPIPSNPMQKKLLECYLETETNWNSFNNIADTLLSSPQQDLDLLLLVFQGYQKQKGNQEIEAKRKAIYQQIQQFSLSDPEDYILLSTFFVGQQDFQRARHILKTGISLFPGQEELLYSYIDVSLEAKNYQDVVQILEPDQLNHWDDPHLYMIYLQSIRYTKSTITEEDYEKYGPYFSKVKNAESKNADIYMLQISFLKDIPTAQKEMEKLLQEAIENEISSRTFFEQAVSHSIHQCYRIPLQIALEACEQYMEGPFERLFIQYIQQMGCEFKDFGSAAFFWNLFLQRKNRVAKNFYHSCIEDAQYRYKKEQEKTILVDSKAPCGSLLKEFILASYQELLKLHPNNEIGIQKMSFLATVDPKVAEIEMRNGLQENPQNDSLNKAMGDLLFEQNQYSQASLYYQKIVLRNLSWEDASTVQKRIVESLFNAGMKEELFAFVQDLKKASNLPPYVLKILAKEAYQKSVFLDFPEALEASKDFAMQAVECTKPDQELLLLYASILQALHQIPKALSILDQNTDSSHPLFSLKRALLLYEMFRQTGHSKYLEDADFELFSIELPTIFPENLSSIVAESIVSPSSMKGTIALPSQPQWQPLASPLLCGKILLVDPTKGPEISVLTMKKKEGCGRLFCDSPYPYALEKEWDIVKLWFDSISLVSTQDINGHDWFLTLDPVRPLPYEPAAFRFQLALAILSCLLEIDLGNVVVATYFSDIEGRVETSNKAAYTLQVLTHDVRFQSKTIIVPIGNVSDVLLEYLKKPDGFCYWIATSSFGHLVESFFEV